MLLVNRARGIKSFCLHHGKLNVIHLSIARKVVFTFTHRKKEESYHRTSYVYTRLSRIYRVTFVVEGRRMVLRCRGGFGGQARMRATLTRPAVVVTRRCGPTRMTPARGAIQYEDAPMQYTKTLARKPDVTRPLMICIRSEFYVGKKKEL